MADIKNKAKSKIKGEAKKIVKKVGTKIAKKVLSKFLINLIPFIGTLLALTTLAMFRDLGSNVMSPTGIMSVVILGPILDIISFFFPFVGAIINDTIYAIWLYFMDFDSGSKSDKKDEPEEIIELEEGKDGTYKVKPKEGTAPTKTGGQTPSTSKPLTPTKSPSKK